MHQGYGGFHQASPSTLSPSSKRVNTCFGLGITKILRISTSSGIGKPHKVSDDYLMAVKIFSNKPRMDLKHKTYKTYRSFKPNQTYQPQPGSNFKPSAFTNDTFCTSPKKISRLFPPKLGASGPSKGRPSGSRILPRRSLLHFVCKNFSLVERTVEKKNNPWRFWCRFLKTKNFR